MKLESLSHCASSWLREKDLMMTKNGHQVSKFNPGSFFQVTHAFIVVGTKFKGLFKYTYRIDSIYTSSLKERALE